MATNVCLWCVSKLPRRACQYLGALPLPAPPPPAGRHRCPHKHTHPHHAGHHNACQGAPAEGVAAPAKVAAPWSLLQLQSAMRVRAATTVASRHRVRSCIQVERWLPMIDEWRLRILFPAESTCSCCLNSELVPEGELHPLQSKNRWAGGNEKGGVPQQSLHWGHCSLSVQISHLQARCRYLCCHADQITCHDRDAELLLAREQKARPS